MFIDEADEQDASKAGDSQGLASQGWLAPSTQPYVCTTRSTWPQG